MYNVQIIKDLLSKRFQDVERAFQELDESNTRRLTQEMMFQLLKRYIILYVFCFNYKHKFVSRLVIELLSTNYQPRTKISDVLRCGGKALSLTNLVIVESGLCQQTLVFVISSISK